MRRPIELSAAMHDMLAAYAELVGLPLEQALVDLIVISYSTAKHNALSREGE